jgi:YD repeat-containing protein
VAEALSQFMWNCFQLGGEGGGVSVIRIGFVVVVLVLLVGALSGGAKAQSNPCIVWDSCSDYNVGTFGLGCLPQLSMAAFNCWGMSWSMYCSLFDSSCPPAAAPREIPRCPCETAGQNSSATGTAGSPISLATGDTWIDQTDFAIPGLGGGLRLVRSWNSLWPPTQAATQVGLFGPNWRSTFEERVFVGTDNYIKYARSDGSFWSFGWNPQANANSTAAPANAGATLIQGISYWTLTLKNGEQRLFDITSGNLIAIIDRNGNTTQVSYNAGGQLATVTDPASRHLYFNYGTGSTAMLVTSVTSDFGVSVSYSYDSQGRLLQITEPDQSTLNFQYDSNSNIATVLDTNGKILESHTYDSAGRGLTSSRANGVEAVTVSYPQ